MKFVYTLLSMFFISVVLATPVDSLGVEKRTEGLFVVHEVEEKETLYSIARRYNGAVSDIIAYNQILDNRIEIGQVIYVLIQDEPKSEPLTQPNTTKIEPIPAGKVHVVAPGETLYSISRRYDIKLKDLKKWNDLSGNDIGQGMELKLARRVKHSSKNEPVAVSKPVVVPLPTKEDPSLPDQHFYEDFKRYLVQTGETLSTIAAKVGVSIDSLKQWNNLNTDYLKIGQELFVKKNLPVARTKLNEPNKKLRKQLDKDGFERVYEEGIASVIEKMKTTRYLALHRTLPIGTNLKVRNLMNNQVVFVKVVGRLPNTGLNERILLRLSQPAYSQLGILDAKSRVEVSYNKE